MLHEYAVEPSLLNNWKDFRYFTEKFGVSRGRLISRYPKRWKKLVYDSLTNCGDVERKRIEEALQRLDERMIRRQHDWNPHCDWLSNAETEHGRRPFHAILACANPRQRDFVLEGDSVDASHPLWEVATSRVIARQAPAMAACVAPLLRSCTEVIFVDPHFRPHELRYRRPLAAFLATVIDNRQHPWPRRIEIHTGDELSADYFKRECQHCLPSLVPQGMRVRIVRWRSQRGGDILHNRYILTDLGGVSFGCGLDDSDAGGTDDVMLLEDVSYRFRWAQFSGAEPAFELVDEQIIEGSRGLQTP